MATLPKEHKEIYFDALIRTNKADSVLALIKATYFAYESGVANVKEEIAKRLENAYNLLRKNPKGTESGAGSYSGTMDQFSSQYTLGHEMGIWVDSDLHLSELALKVATDEITVKDYFRIIFLNYIQPVDGKIIHPLYMLLKYMKDNQISELSKDKLSVVYGVKCEDGNANGLVNFLLDTEYFTYKSGVLFFNIKYSLEELLLKCNTKYLGNDGYSKAQTELNNPEIYHKYLSNENKNYLFKSKTLVEVYKMFQKWITSDLNPEKLNRASGYGSNLAKIFNILEEKGKIYPESLRCSDESYYDFIKQQYENDEEAKNIDALQHYPARAAIPHYINFIKQIKVFGEEYLEMKIKEFESKKTTEISIKEIVKKRYDARDFEYIDILPIYNEMQQNYGLEVLQKTNGRELLLLLFAPKSINENGLTYRLEFDKSLRPFGSISGGSAYKMSLYYSDSKGWISGTHKSNSRVISEEEAIDMAEEIRDKLISVIVYLNNLGELTSLDDYQKLDNILVEKLGSLYFHSWVQKYLALIFPSIFTNFYGKIENMEWCSKAFEKMGIKPSKNITLRHGQFVLYFKELMIPNFYVYRIVLEMNEKNEIDGHAWLISANSQMYDHESSFEKNGAIDWHKTQHMKSIGVNDTVYIYVSKPDSKIKYKCKVIATDIPINESMDDSEFWLSMDGANNCDECVRLKLTNKVDDDRLSIHKLLENGLKAAPQGTIKLDGDKLLLAQYISSIFDEQDNETNDFTEIETSVILNFEIMGRGKNLVVYGTPGCGKSYYVENTLLKNHKLLADNTRERVIRTTFYQDYTNTDFIGQILPHIKKDKEGKDVVTYKFNPGPFALALKEALSCDGQEVALVIEELNRGNAPAIFGDIFQLLDRDENGISKYAITNVNLLNWLNEELKSNLKNIKIPGNLFIYATMNTSDQNVFTLDTAFKRRWEFKKIKNEFKADHAFAEQYVPGMSLTWKDFVNSINIFMTNDQSIIRAEDKQIGVYFIDKDGMRKEVVDIATTEQKEEFAYKIFEYLWDDVAKFDRKRWFRGEIKTLDDLIDKYIADGISVFNEDVFGHELYTNGSVKKDSGSSETE